MSLFNIFENLKLTGKFWRRIGPYISGYLLAFILAFLVVGIIYVFDRTLIAGFTLFSFLPGWLRFVCLDLIASALIGIPFGIIAGFLISQSIQDYNINYLRNRLKIECIECSKSIEPQEGIWASGQLDIRCKCGALMTATIEEGQLKKLVLTESRKYK